MKQSSHSHPAVTGALWLIISLSDRNSGLFEGGFCVRDSVSPHFLFSKIANPYADESEVYHH